jgi:hypothetical protein
VRLDAAGLAVAIDAKGAWLINAVATHLPG